MASEHSPASCRHAPCECVDLSQVAGRGCVASPSPSPAQSVESDVTVQATWCGLMQGGLKIMLEDAVLLDVAGCTEATYAVTAMPPVCNPQRRTGTRCVEFGHWHRIASVLQNNVELMCSRVKIGRRVLLSAWGARSYARWECRTHAWCGAKV